VPLADYRGLITSPLKQLGKSLLAAIEFDAIVDNTVEVAVFAGKYHRATGRTNRISTEAVFKEHSLFGESVEVRCLVNFATITAKSMRCMVVSHYKNDIGFFRRAW
jgi:hypothetical protein